MPPFMAFSRISATSSQASFLTLSSRSTASQLWLLAPTTLQLLFLLQHLKMALRTMQIWYFCQHQIKLAVSLASSSSTRSSNRLLLVLYVDYIWLNGKVSWQILWCSVENSEGRFFCIALNSHYVWLCLKIRSFFLVVNVCNPPSFLTEFLPLWQPFLWQAGQKRLLSWAVHIESGGNLLQWNTYFFVQCDPSLTIHIPEFRVDDTRLEPTQYTYGGVVNYMIIYTDRLTRGMSSTYTSLFYSPTVSRRYCAFTEVHSSVWWSLRALIL